MALPADVIGNILVYACESPKDAAARRWCPSKAWLEAYEAPALWRTLTLSTLPTARAHCAMSAWARAPQRLRRAVERHTREVVVKDAMTTGRWEKPPYSFGRGLEGQQFARLRMVTLSVWNKSTQQGIEEDEAALRPLFGAECASIELSDYGLLQRRIGNADCYLRSRRAYEILGNFTNLRRLDLCESSTDVLLQPDSMHHCLVALEDDFFTDRVETLTYLTQEQARRLTELNSLSLEQFLAPGTIPANFFQHMQRLF